MSMANNNNNHTWRSVARFHDNMSTTQVNSSSNSSASVWRRYVFTPLDSEVKITLSIVMYTVAVLAVIGNALVLFIKHKQRRLPRAAKAFNRSVTAHFVLSLALSDLLTSFLAIPTFNLNMWLDLAPDNWSCKASRFVIIMFPVITINNLIVMCIERYLAIFHPFSVPTKKTTIRLVIGAWVVGVFITLIPASTYGLIPFIIDSDHYTFACLYDKRVPAFRVMFLSFTLLVYFLPCILLTILSVRVLKYIKTSRVNQAPPTTVASNKWRFKGSRMCASLILAFVLPYMFWMFYSIINIILKPNFSFQTDFVIRYSFVTVVFANAVVNPVIYFYHSKEMRNVLIGELYKGTRMQATSRVIFVKSSPRATRPTPSTVPALPFVKS